MQDVRTVRFDLQASAKQTMIAHGFQPDFPAEVQAQLASIVARPPAVSPASSVRDLREFLWSSIDNDTSRDLDQIEYAERLPDGNTKVLIGIADVDVFVAKGSPIDSYASRETTSVYTGVRNFSMLPEQLSTGLTSLLENQDRLSVVIEYKIDAGGNVIASEVYRAVVRNRAQLAYNAVGAWLEGTSAAPPKVAASTELQAQLKLQDQTAQALRNQRFRVGALDLETSENRPVVVDDKIVDIMGQQKNHATGLIEDFMIAANGVIARLLRDKQRSAIRRVVKTPERWDRIVALAAESGDKLPTVPDSKALNEFLIRRKAADPDRFPDLSLAVIKLLGPGEYILERPGDPEQGHFGLAVQDYTHSTAPNRRFADLVAQRLVKSLLSGQPAPYSDAELASIAQNCTLKESAERKVEREMSKRIAAVAMSSKIGQTFDAIVTGVAKGATFVRALQPHVDGMLVHGQQGVDVGDRLRVKLVNTDVAHGYIDYARV
jgi:exoribonuclease-2